MGVKFVTNTVEGKSTIESCFIESTKDVGGLIVYQNKDGADDSSKKENDKVVFAFEIDWEKREVIPCYADYYHMYTTEDNENIKM